MTASDLRTYGGIRGPRSGFESRPYGRRLLPRHLRHRRRPFAQVVLQAIPKPPESSIRRLRNT